MSDWSYMLGLDFGVRDATAYVVIAYRKNDPTVYVVESWKERGKPPSHVAQEVKTLMGRYSLSRIIGDLGGMGKAFAEEMIVRFQIPIEAAEKQNKLGFISLMNGAFERGQLVIVEDTNQQLIRELKELPWANDLHQKTAAGAEDHLCDALLYVWRACFAFTEKVPEPKPEPGSPEAYQAEAIVHLDRRREAARKQHEEPWWRRNRRA